MVLKRALTVFAVLLSGYLVLQVPALHADGGAGRKDVVEVKIINVAFEPKEITVHAGTTVRWVNIDPVPHDVTSGTAITGRRARQVKKVKFPDGKFHSGAYGKGEGFEVVFNEKGKFHYFCNIHPIMQGVVTVR